MADFALLSKFEKLYISIFRYRNSIKMEFLLLYSFSNRLCMLATATEVEVKKCPTCDSNLDEVNYDENDGAIKHVSFVLNNGSKMRGQIRVYICGRCSLVQEFIVPY